MAYKPRECYNFHSVFRPIHPPTYCSSWKEEFEVTKEVIRIRISTDNTCTMAKRKSTKGQTTIHKTHIQNQRSSNMNPTTNRGERRCSGRVGSSCPTSGTRRVNLVTNLVLCHEWGKLRAIYEKLNYFYIQLKQ
jgi:hypothetical protein